jgi:monofunctional biosynthetic peptidoglycan transglycosylase
MKNRNAGRTMHTIIGARDSNIRKRAAVLALPTAIVFLGLLGLPASGVLIGQDEVPEIRPIIDFSRQGGVRGVDDWLVVNDGVMGGISTSQIQATSSGTAVFTGHLSLENNGGFASVRTRLDGLDLTEFDGIAIRARGDGRTYQLRFRTDRRFDGVTYRTTFVTKPGEWTIVRLPFTKFEPTFRGRRLRGVEPLDTSRLQQLAFMVADKNEGPFRLEVQWVKPFVEEEPQPSY